MRESRTSGSAGALGRQQPGATRPLESIFARSSRARTLRSWGSIISVGRPSISARVFSLPARRDPCRLPKTRRPRATQGSPTGRAGAKQDRATPQAQIALHRRMGRRPKRRSRAVRPSRSTPRCRRTRRARHPTTRITTAFRTASTAVPTILRRSRRDSADATHPTSIATATASPMHRPVPTRSEQHGERPVRVRRGSDVAAFGDAVHRFGVPSGRGDLQCRRRLRRSQRVQPVPGRSLRHVGRRRPVLALRRDFPARTGARLRRRRRRRRTRNGAHVRAERVRCERPHAPPRCVERRE
jgi:hypothetical protein